MTQLGEAIEKYKGMIDEYPTPEAVEKAIQIKDTIMLKGWYACLRMAENDAERALMDRIVEATLKLDSRTVSKKKHR